jgi:F-type H+-transporting ATPase subunit delta
MKDIQTAKFYAQAAIELGKENNVDMAGELTKLTEVINASNDLENVLFLDVFTNEEKSDVFKTLATKLGLSTVTTTIVNFLIEEKRINSLPLIYKELMVIDDHEKGFIRGVIEGSESSISDEAKNKIMAVIKAKLNKEPVLEYAKSETVTAGYRVTVEDLQLDASIDNQLKSFKESVLN